jgi:tRNA (guanine6-N2)-methyltransferase
MTTEHYAPGFFLEAHFVQGLAPFALQELRQLLKGEFCPLAPKGAIAIRFRPIRDLPILNRLRTVAAVYLGYTYAIPRPKALLGHHHYQRLLAQLTQAQRASPTHTFRSFRIDAAGADSAVFQRLRQQIADGTRLVDDPVDGELLNRVFPAQGAGNAWTVLCRLTPRPLSARAWRVIDMPGALNATVAATMVHMSQPRPTDRVLNLMCGSGTLLIERLLHQRVEGMAGCDTNVDALYAAAQNLAAAGLAGQVRLLCEDATRLAMPVQHFDVLFADLPWGQLIGAHATNGELYPRVLQAAARMAMPGARLVVITSEVRLFEQTVRQHAHLWQLCDTVRLDFKQVRPRIYRLQRTSIAG